MVTIEATDTERLPDGYQARPARLEDLVETVDMLNAVSRASLGVSEHSVVELTGQWQMPGFALGADTRLVLAADGSVAAFALVWDLDLHVAPETWGRVHPAYTGHGLGTYLLRWAENRGRQAVSKAPAQALVTLQAWIPSRDAETQNLFRAFGYSLVRESLRMVIDFDTPPPAPGWPAGVDVRTIVPGLDERAVVQANGEAFRDEWGWVDEPLEARLERWQHFARSDPDYDPSLFFLAVAGDQIIGTSFCRMKLTEAPEMAWIFSLGVVRPWRRQGVASALLRHAFGELYRRGRRKAGLGVDATSLTGATRLYEKAGMRRDPAHQYGIWEKELRPGQDLATRG